MLQSLQSHSMDVFPLAGCPQSRKQTVIVCHSRASGWVEGNILNIFWLETDSLTFSFVQIYKGFHSGCIESPIYGRISKPLGVQLVRFVRFSYF
jgi:hypothetical protein